MLDPFLVLDPFEGSPEHNIDNQKPFQNNKIELEHLQLYDDVPRTNMTITGKLNPEDGAIILKVQIADKEGIPSFFRAFVFPSAIMIFISVYR